MTVLAPLPPCPHCEQPVDRQAPRVLYGTAWVHPACADRARAANPPAPVTHVDHRSMWS